MPFRLLVLAAALLLSVACHPSRPVLDPGPQPDVGGSISGTVTAGSGGLALGARQVTAINTETGARFDVSTTTTGGYTVRVPKGRYRLEVELRGGETLATQPDPTDVDPGDLDAGRNFVVAVR
jgi:hypothetical protein